MSGIPALKQAMSPESSHGFTHSGSGYVRPQISPWEKDLEQAADVLHPGSKVAILNGAGPRTAANEVMEVAKVLVAGARLGIAYGSIRRTRGL